MLRDLQDLTNAALTPAAPIAWSTPTLALARDADALCELRDVAANWQASRGIKQWRPGDIAAHTFATQIADGQWWVVRDDDKTVPLLGCVRLLWEDIPYWGPQPPVAGYIHGLIARPGTARTRGLGAELIRWAQERIAEAGRPLARLDCIATNEPLKAYYRGQGYRDVRLATPDHLRYSVQLFEKRLAP